MTTTTPEKAGNNVSRMSQIFSKGSAVPTRNGPEKKRTCKARFSYTAEQDDELSFEAGEIIEVVEDIEEGWMKGIMQSTKKMGLFPTNFVNFPPDDGTENGYGIKQKSTPAAPTAATTHVKATTAPAASPEKKDDKKIDQSAAINTHPLIATSARRLPSTSSVENSDNNVSIAGSESKKQSERAKVLYSYEATQEDELSLTEGSYVRILDKKSTDDGWYLGEFEGNQGVFPSNFVKIISKSSDTPPTPPPVKPPKPPMSNPDDSKHHNEKSIKEPPVKPLGLDTKAAETPVKNAAFNNSANERSTRSTYASEPKSSGVNAADSLSSTTSGSNAVSSTRIRDLQNNLFGNRLPPKPGDKPARPVTTIGDITASADSDVEKEADQVDSKMSHPQRDRPRQTNKRPPSMMPVAIDDILNGSVASSSATTTNFPAKEVSPVVTHKPALSTGSSKKCDNEPMKDNKPAAYKVSHTETTLMPVKKSHPPPASTSNAPVSSPVSPMALVDDNIMVSGKELNNVIKTLNRLIKFQNQSAC